MTLGATLYIKDTTSAIEFYRQAFGLVLGYYEKFDDGTYLHAELCKDGKEIFAVSEHTNAALVKATMDSDRPIMSYGIDFDTEEQVRHAFAILSREGKVVHPIGPLPWNACCAEVVDQYGVFWYICLR